MCIRENLRSSVSSKNRVLSVSSAPDQIVGQYFADMIIDEKVIVEIKAKKCLMPEDEAQVLNYLKATDKEVGLLLNFGPKPELNRKVFDNSKK